MNIPSSQVKFITCGIFNSNSWSTPKTYRIYSDRIECDPSGNYFSERFSKNGYQFRGKQQKIEQADIILINTIFGKIPKHCFMLNLPLPNTPGNKDEHTIYVELSLIDGKTIKFKIDEYNQQDLNVDNTILIFKDEIKETIKLIEEKLNE